jgi:hypothetical protein
VFSLWGDLAWVSNHGQNSSHNKSTHKHVMFWWWFGIYFCWLKIHAPWNISLKTRILHYYKMCCNSLWVSLDLRWIWHFYLLKLFNTLVNWNQLLHTMNYF